MFRLLSVIIRREYVKKEDSQNVFVIAVSEFRFLQLYLFHRNDNSTYLTAFKSHPFYSCPIMNSYIVSIMKD